MPNPIDLCLAADVAQDLGVSESAVARSVTAASALVAGYLGFPIHQETVTEYPTSGGTTALVLARAPIASITSITVCGSALQTGDFHADFPAGIVYRNTPWPSTGVIGGYLTPSIADYQPNPDALAVVYKAGFVTPGQNALDPATYPTVDLPVSIQEATIQVATGLYRQRGSDPTIASQSLGDWSVSMRAPGDSNPLSATVKALLAPYRRVF